jgi:hypothetical protein
MQNSKIKLTNPKTWQTEIAGASAISYDSDKITIL